MITSLSVVLSQKIIPLLLAFVGFCSVVVVHEFGHFLFCKLFKIHTPTFSIGFGPQLFARKIGDTLFRLAAIPLGGYVEIAGFEEVGQGEQKHAGDAGPEAFRSKPYWQKLLVLLGGIMFNLISAYIVYSVLFMTGLPKTKLQIAEVVSNSRAEQAGIKAGDIFAKINGHDVLDNPQNLVEQLEKLSQYTGKEATITVKRQNELVTLPIEIPQAQDSERVRLGVKFAEVPTSETKRYPFLTAIKMGIKQTNVMIVRTAQLVKSLFVRRSLTGLGGPIAIFSECFNCARYGFNFFFAFLAFLSVNLALLNLLPLPILDGGQLVFVTIESIIGREIPLVIKNTIHITFVALFLALVLYLSYHDILRLIKTMLG